jgi:hypothetical protein
MQGKVWWVRRTNPREGYMVFVPRGSSKKQDGISSTMLRRLFFNPSISSEAFGEKAKNLVPNSRLLTMYMGLNKTWSTGTWKRVSTSERAEDDVAMRDGRRVKKEKTGKRRNSCVW